MARATFGKAVCTKCQFFVRFLVIDGARKFFDAELVSIVNLDGLEVKGYRPHEPTCLAMRTRKERLAFKRGSKG